MTNADTIFILQALAIVGWLVSISYIINNKLENVSFVRALDWGELHNIRLGKVVAVGGLAAVVYCVVYASSLQCNIR